LESGIYGKAIVAKMVSLILINVNFALQIVDHWVGQSPLGDDLLCIAPWLVNHL